MPSGAFRQLQQAGREVSEEEVELIRETVELFPSLSREELARTICDHLGWYAATGAPKREACGKLLSRLEAQGVIQLPAKRSVPRGGPRGARGWTHQTDPGPRAQGALAGLGRVGREVVTEPEERELWNEYVDRYHYLGYKAPFGCYLRYFVASEKGRLGCVLLAGAAKAIRVRDEWIGWTRPQRLNNLGWVVNNTRFLVFPWVEVSHLASHILGQVARRVAEDWQERWGYRPVLLETFVDPEKYRGTCYRASGWELVGQTTGEGKPRRGKRYETTVKLVFVRPLERNFREALCSEVLAKAPVER
jgi:hypothetical protein